MFKRLVRRAAVPFVGYLITTFNNKNGVFQYLSNGNDAFNFRPLNGNHPTLPVHHGTGAVRDPFVLSSPDRNSFWIIGTDLDIDKTTWSKAQSHGSRNLLIWYSKDMVHWTNSYMLPVENKEAGYAWAPSALWSEEKNAYVIFWSARIYSADDRDHKRASLRSVIRYTTTTDFKSVTPPQDFYEIPDSAIIDQEFVPLSNGQYLLFLKDERKGVVTAFVSTAGLFGKQWMPTSLRLHGVEGATAFRDNIDNSLVHLWVDRIESATQHNGYVSYEATLDENDPTAIAFSQSDKAVTPDRLRHGSVTPLTQAEYDRIETAHFLQKP